MLPRALLPPLAVGVLALAVHHTTTRATGVTHAVASAVAVASAASPPALTEQVAHDAPTEAPRQVPFGRRLDAPHDPWADSADDAAACRDALRAAGVTFRALPDRAKRDAQGCGIPHPVFVTKGPTGITYAGPLLIDCSLARELPDIERVIQEQAVASLGERIVRVETLGSYSCRPKRGARREGLSEHALGNAVDLAAFRGKGAKAWASVALHYDPDGKRPPTAAGDFLHALQQHLRLETRLTRVLGPDWNASHRDHFHIDRGVPWWWSHS